MKQRFLRLQRRTEGWRWGPHDDFHCLPHSNAVVPFFVFSVDVDLIIFIAHY